MTTSSQPAPSKVLFIRLSSLGDVILSTAALSALSSRALPPSEVHWVTSREYTPLLRGHPAIHRLWEFDRAGGLFDWFKLCASLWDEDFSEVIDLHSNLRSKIARLYFFFRKMSAKTASLSPPPSWKVLSKQRFRLRGYFVFRALWPAQWRPSPLVERFSELGGANRNGRPDLRHLLKGDASSLPVEFLEFASKPFLAVMPSSRWDGKKWPVSRYLSAILSFGAPVVVLGSESDRESVLLLKLLEQAGHPAFSGVGHFNFIQLASVLERSLGYLGNDTGLAHLAEAIGKPATLVFGPTVPEMGFGPWRAESRSVRSGIWCSPCGKDGRMCFRVGNRFACLNEIEPDAVVQSLREMTHG